MNDDLGDGLRARVEGLEVEVRNLEELLVEQTRLVSETFNLWLADQQRIDAALALDPADHATRSRDYGRGFADAIHRSRAALRGDL